MARFDVEAVAEHEYLVRAASGADSAESRFSVDPGVLDELGVTGVEERTVVEHTAAFLAERQPVEDFPPIIDLDDVIASYDDYPDQLRRRVRG
ncbi:hypothetical protein [Gandjariella thermophila]|uniref:Uncharacterized protein n=1 Tax=Gandjariella thermophila TaxID=1931992 RepID=A0A4D4IWC8_9PSEU|nr:hypothetical protein [Gandjariella thermophila]GDY28491.1 hypothetical protein GTS_01240 [Gandjariella thermophila]